MTNKLPPQAPTEQARGTFRAGDYLEAAQAFDEAAEAHGNPSDAPMAAGIKKILFVRPW